MTFASYESSPGAFARTFVVSFLVIVGTTVACNAYLMWRVGVVDPGLLSSAPPTIDRQSISPYGRAYVAQKTLMAMTVSAAITVTTFGILWLLLHRGIKANHQQRFRSVQSLHESERRFRQIFVSEPACVKLLDASGRLIDMNPAGLAMIEVDSIDDVRGKCVYDFISRHDRAAFIEATEAVIRGEPRSMQFEVVGRKGTRRTLESNAVLLPRGSDEVDTVLAITHDITDRVRTEQELERHRDTMAHANRVNVMGEMASSIAHELTQPISTLANFAYAIESLTNDTHPDMKLLRQHGASLRNEASRAAEIIRGLQRMVRKTETECTQVDLNSMVQSSQPLFSHDLRLHEIQFDQNLQADLPLIFCNPVQVQQVLLNLVRNAIESMRDEPADVRRLCITTAHRNGSEVELTVEDCGRGVEEAQRKLIFDAFYSTKSDGMGMGLAISKSIAEAHGGNLVAEVAEAKGSIFRLTLPVGVDPNA